MPTEPRRMQLTGLHHLTAISGDLERTLAFYRDLLGLGVVHDGPSDDDPGTRHVWFAIGDAGQRISFMDYPQMPDGVVGRGSTHHFALSVDSDEELGAWRDYLRSRDVDCTDVLERTGVGCSIYVRDPDGHVVEIAVPARGA